MNTTNNFDDNELDEAFRSALDDRRMPVPPAVWANVRATALEKQLIKTRILNNWLRGATALLAACLALALYFLGKQSVSPATDGKSMAATTKQQPANPTGAPTNADSDSPDKPQIRAGLPLGMTVDRGQLTAIEKRAVQPAQEAASPTLTGRPDSKLAETLPAQADEAAESSNDSERTAEPALAPTKNRAEDEMPEGSEMLPTAPESENNLIINSQSELMHQPDGSNATYQPVLMPQTPAGAYPMAPIRSLNEPQTGAGQLQRTAVQPYSWSVFRMFDYLAPLLPKPATKRVHKKNKAGN
ncbi:hypothetical protein [Arsenicibacter rosenii]|uniref:Uncharacterized protein n=1 Tax=Arsenicibacter rosenii TaxID=1750698 RepID=A0A1S2VE44_9BACT|nr:hypothetical protein [Arsenicibacter rosenii]OIN57027.1 hypothetical protein BLX24_22025 [Arsenicibacter rosenii]